MLTTTSFLALCSSAVATHLWFKGHEPQSLPPIYITIFVLPALPAYFVYKDVASLVLAALIAYPSFYVLLLTSITLYRLSPVHPLAEFPGPAAARISKIWTVWKAIDGKLSHHYKQLHDTYGPIVRVGPNEISVVDKDLLPFIIGSHGMPKGPMWDGRGVGTPRSEKYSLINVRDLAHHSLRRKPWNRAFADQNLPDYQDILVPNANNLITELEKQCKNGSGIVDISSRINFFAFDFMGDLAFGEDFDVQRSNDSQHFQENMTKALLIPAFTMHVPWTAAILQSYPSLRSNSLLDFIAFAVQRAKLRASNESRKDLFYHLIENSEIPADSAFPFIVSNAVLAMIAGSDTTASALTTAVYYLLSNPKDLARLSAEIQEFFPPNSDGTTTVEMSKLSGMSWLNAIINETLRLQPPVPSGLQRAPAAGSGGKMIGSHYIKEGTAVLVPSYVLHRDPRYFSPDPDKFWPARWLEENRSNVILDTAAFIPFSQGQANCAGRRLAMTELRYVLVLLFSRFNISFAPESDPLEWERDLKDRFVLDKERLMVSLSLKRSKPSSS